MAINYCRKRPIFRFYLINTYADPYHANAAQPTALNAAFV